MLGRSQMRQRPPNDEDRAEEIDDAWIRKNRPCLHTSSADEAQAPEKLTAILHAPERRSSDRYSIEFDGELIVKGSRVAELDCARVLLSRGITGKLIIVDGATGRHRTTIDI